LVRKLEHGAFLSPSDVKALERSVTLVKEIGAHEDIIKEGDRPELVHVVLEGFACRYKLLPDGSRQIIAWLAPGDFCDLHIAILGRMDHSIATLSASKLALIAPESVIGLTQVSPNLSRALWWASLVDEAILREWLVGMGRRSADRQIAHLFCELHARLKAVGLARENLLVMPVTQAELADTVGMSAVHVNRTIQHLRAEGLIRWRGKMLSILDVDGLRAFASFDPNYLHLDKREERPAGNWARKS
jgi:CRP-like cAMP-binding protein